jgi:TFIIF-interacting CTD phosphatase-like protein
VRPSSYHIPQAGQQRQQQQAISYLSNKVPYLISKIKLPLPYIIISKKLPLPYIMQGEHKISP